MGYYFLLNRTVVSQSSKKQRIISISTTKAKYIVFGYATREAVQINEFINEMGLEIIVNLILYGDNEMSIALTKGAKS